MTVWFLSSNQHQNAGPGGYLEQAWAQQTTGYAVARLRARLVAAENVFRPGAGTASTDELAQMVAEVNTRGKPGDVCYSIHSNAAAGYSLGILVLVYSSLRKEWGEKVGRRLAETLGLPYKGIAFRPDLMVLSKSAWPCCLMEVNAHDTQEGAQYNLTHQEAIGRAVADAHLFAMGKEEEPEPVIVVDYGEEDRERLHRDLARSLGFSYDLKIIKSFLRGDEAAALDTLEKEKLTAVNRERKGLGLEAAGADSVFVWGTPPPPKPVPGFTLETPVAGVVEMTTGELAERLPAEAVYNRVDVAAAYREWCAKFGLRLDIVWAQMILETDGLRYTGDVDPSRTRHNFCGLKDGLGLGWASFTTINLGVVAHCAHLAAYVYPNHVLPECNRAHDPRHPENHQTWQEAHGAIVQVKDFGGGRWAEDTEYAAKLVRVWERGA